MSLLSPYAKGKFGIRYPHGETVIKKLKAKIRVIMQKPKGLHPKTVYKPSQAGGEVWNRFSFTALRESNAFQHLDLSSSLRLC